MASRSCGEDGLQPGDYCVAMQGGVNTGFKHSATIYVHKQTVGRGATLARAPRGARRP